MEKLFVSFADILASLARQFSTLLCIGDFYQAKMPESLRKEKV